MARGFTKNGVSGPVQDDPTGSFSDALKRFRENASRSVPEPRRSRIERALVADLRGESIREGKPDRRALRAERGALPALQTSKEILTVFGLAAKVLRLADENKQLTPAAISERTGCSRSTAYRYLSSVRNLQEQR